MNVKTITAKLPRGFVTFTAGSVIYLMIIEVLTGIRPEHLIIIGIMNLMFWSGNGTRKFIIGFAAFAIFGMVYDLMRAFPNYNFNSVDIAGLYHFEKNIFGINEDGVRITPNEFFAIHHSAAGDIIAGLFYVNWMPVPLAFAVWLFFRDRTLFLHFALTFLFVNLIGFLIYYIHPAAPPWYIEKYGFGLHLNVPGSTAELHRFDAMTGIPVFASIYVKNSNVFAAIPSLHCAYPVIVLFYGYLSGPKWLVLPLMVFMTGIWFAAVYSGHHYVTDVLLGILCAIAGLFIYRKILLKSSGYRNFFNRYLSMIY